jgi:oxygen-dependent protoporphyrinogen oxidase
MSKIAVVGAGIAGLTCAYELQKKGHDVTVFEKEDFLGGRMSTRTKEDLPFDIGANHLIPLYHEMQKYNAEFGIEMYPHKHVSYGVSKDGKLPHPGKAVGLWSRFKLIIQNIYLKPQPSFLNLNAFEKYDDETGYDYMARKTTKEVADYIVDPFASAYQFHRADEISKAVVIPALYSIRRENKEWDLHSNKGGMISLPNALGKKLKVKLSSSITKVKAADKIEITHGNETQSFDLAVLACTADITNQIYKNPTPQQKEVLNATRYATTISIAFKMPVETLVERTLVWCPYIQSKTISSYATEDQKGSDFIKNGKTLLCVWLHEDFAKSLINKSDEEIHEAVKKEVPNVCPLIPDPSILENYDIQRWPAAMPKFYKGFIKKVAQFFRDGQGDQNVYFCGDYLNAPWTEGALRLGKRTAELISTKHQ